MADGLTIRTNAADLIREFDILPQNMQDEMRSGLIRKLLLVEDQVRANSELKARRGAAGLFGRLTSFVRVGGRLVFDAAIGFRKTKGFPYELSHETGARAKPGKAMAIPISALAKRASNRGQGPRDINKDLFIPKGTHVLVESHGLKGFQAGKGLFTVHYVLVKSLPRRLHFIRTVTDALPSIEQAIVDGAKKGARKT